MAIVDRITSMEDHLKESYQELEGIGIDTTGLNKNLENIPKLIDVYWGTLPKVTDEGTSITLDNTKEGKMKIVLKGNTSQEGTPTPEAPQDIHVVSGDNSIEVCGKNLAISDYNKWTKTGAYDYVPIKLKQGQTYTLSAKLVGEQKSSYYNFGIVKDGTTLQTFVDRYFIINYNNGSVNNKYTFTVDQTWTNPKLVAFLGGSETKFNELFTNYELQLEVGNQATTYEPYQSTSYPISLGDIELCKIGTYQDSIVKDNGKWYLNKQIGKVVLNGSENWTTNSGWYYTNTNIYILSQNPKTTEQVYSDKFFFYRSAYTNDINGEVGLVWGNTLSFRISNTLASDTEAFKTWLSNNNTTVYYVLATPTYTKIEGELASQLEALSGAKSYTGQTNISQENNDMPFELDVEALKEDE